jgi:hypothetical protein
MLKLSSEFVKTQIFVFVQVRLYATMGKTFLGSSWVPSPLSINPQL